MANDFTNEKLADMHLMYGLSEVNGREALRLYTERFPMRRAPNHRYFAQLHQNLRETGSFMVDKPWPLNGINISPARLPRQGGSISAGMMVTILVWGATDEEKTNPEILMKQNVMVVLDRDCKERWWNSTYTNIDEKKMCTRNWIHMKPSLALLRDSGGCVVDSGMVIGVAVLHHPDYPAVPYLHTRVSSYIDWIEDTVGPLPIAG